MRHRLSYKVLSERHKKMMEQRDLLKTTIRQLKMEKENYKYLYQEEVKYTKELKRRIGERDIIIDMLYQQVYKNKR